MSKKNDKGRKPATTSNTPAAVDPSTAGLGMGKCAEVHAYCSAFLAHTGREPTVTDVRAECARRQADGGAQNVSNWQQELYAWRKSRGVHGRLNAASVGPAALSVPAL